MNWLKSFWKGIVDTFTPIHSVDSVVKHFSKVVIKLMEVSERELCEATEKSIHVLQLNAEIFDHKAEGQRAARVADKVEKLLNGDAE